ncbi:MAG: hypothetical protein HY706_04355 [Candidatus Hydrogenedentes bacterium]|nr:hypothetical protein [Candidatus Hydrogenedentota bacterium]
MLRARVRRTIETAVGIIVILAGLLLYFILYAAFDNELNRGMFKERMEKRREFHEDYRIRLGFSTPLKWEVFRKTKGHYRSRPRVPDSLYKLKNTEITVVGYVTPIDELGQTRRFMLLPVPLDCYFCGIPRLTDVMLVQLKDAIEAPSPGMPVEITGTLILNGVPNTRFRHILLDAGLEGLDYGDLRKLWAVENKTAKVTLISVSDSRGTLHNSRR